MVLGWHFETGIAGPGFDPPRVYNDAKSPVRVIKEYRGFHHVVAFTDELEKEISCHFFLAPILKDFFPVTTIRSNIEGQVKGLDIALLPRVGTSRFASS